jgi:hypothetical protein
MKGRKNMIDQLTETYADYLEGSYDCPDRIVLNGYYRLGSTGGGFRHWWRRLHGTDDNLDKTHLVRMAGRFSRRVKAYAEKHKIPVLYCQPEERKHELAEVYIPQDPAFVGLFLVIISRASGLVWDAHRTDVGGLGHLTKHYRYINHLFFHIMDPEWGHMTIRISGHPPFRAMIILNGHEYVACQAQQAGLEIEQTSNCFTGIMSPADLAWLAETSCALHTKGQLRQVCERWVYSCLHFALPEAERLRSGFGYEYSLFQMEYSRNLLFRRPAQMEQVFNTLIDRSRSLLDLKRIKTIFGRQRRPHYKGKAKAYRVSVERILERPAYNLTIFKIHFGPWTLKVYTKGEAVLRCEVMVHNVKALHCKRSLDQIPEIMTRLQQILVRFLNQLHCLDQAFVADDTLDTLGHPGHVGSTRTAGIDLNKPRLQAVLQAVIALAPLPGGFTASQLADQVRHLMGWPENQYRPRQAAYDLKKLRGKQWVEKIGNSRRYQPLPTGLKIMAALLTLREKVVKPVLAGAGKPETQRKPQNQTELDIQYRKVQTEMHQLLQLLGIAV